MKKWMLALGVITTMTSSVFAGGNIKFSEYDLPNGLHVILHEDHTTPSVVVSVLYHVGSKNEDPQRTGFAHFFEHLMFEGSDNIKRGEYMKLVEGNGGVLNANTSWDRTYYFQQMPSNQLELALWMEAERMAHLNVDSIGVETQRKVVKEEKKMRYENTPYGHLIEQVCAGSFKDHPYRWTPIGEAQYIDQAKYSEFMDFYKTFYVPNNATLTIAGDFTPAQAKALVEKYYGYIAKGTTEVPRSNIVEKPWTEEVRKTYYDKVQLPGVVFSYHTPAQGSADAYALELLSNALSNGKSSRLQKVIVDQKQMAVGAGSFPMPMEDPGIVMMYGIANMGVKEADLEKEMNDVIEDVVANGISDEELQKVKNQVEDNFVGQNARLMGVAENLANYHVYFQNTDLINTELERYMKVTKADIAAVAKKYFTKNNRLVLYYLPKKEN
jgi:zinc protease